MRDSVVAGVLAGVAGGLFSQAFMTVFYFMGIAATTPSHLGAYIVIRPGLDIMSLPAQSLGAVQHFALASLLGIIILYLLRFMGTDFLGIKGVVYGALAYFLIYGTLARIVIPVHILQPDLATSIVYLFGNLFYGLTTTYVAGYIISLKESPR